MNRFEMINEKLDDIELSLYRHIKPEPRVGRYAGFESGRDDLDTVKDLFKTLSYKIDAIKHFKSESADNIKILTKRLDLISKELVKVSSNN